MRNHGRLLRNLEQLEDRSIPTAGWNAALPTAAAQPNEMAPPLAAQSAAEPASTNRSDGTSCALREKVAGFLSEMLTHDDGQDGSPLSESWLYVTVAGAGVAGLAFINGRIRRPRVPSGASPAFNDPSWDKRPDLVFLPRVEHP